MSDYIIHEWALIRRNEMVDIPDKIHIHPDFLKLIERDEFESAFRQIWDIFYQIYGDIAKEPERFALPMVKESEYRYGSKEANDSRNAPWRPFYLLLFLFGCGEMNGNRFIVNCHEFKSINTVKNPSALLKSLTDYGFTYTELKNYKITSNLESFGMEYPDNPHILIVLELVAKKVLKTQQVRNGSQFSNCFLSWNHRIVNYSFDTIGFESNGEYVADKMHNENDKNFVLTFHKIMKNKGYIPGAGGGNEGPGIKYFQNEKEMLKNTGYLFQTLSWKGNLVFMLRIRNPEKCFDYLDGCSEDIKNMFRHSDPGCQNHINGTCRKGVGYIYEGEERWHCGCCSAAFQLHPCVEDIPHYLKLVELGAKR